LSFFPGDREGWGGTGVLVSFRWLRDYVEIEEPAQEVAEWLTRQGLEVASVRPVRPEMEQVVTGRVVCLERHPEEAHAWICRVDTGDRERTVFCGVGNVLPGDSVPVALPGARLPGGRTIEATSIRGIRSEGMLCSERELMLSEDHEGIMRIDGNPPPGRPLDRTLSLDDQVLEIELTPNRSDCLCVIGIAREIAARKGRPLRLPAVTPRENGGPARDVSSVSILAPEACHRYVARVLEGVSVAPSPFWLRWRLSLAGIRPINNIVDVTNYVMMEWGQPLHAFDLDRLEEHRIVVRKACRDERLTTLDGEARMLTEQDLLICDARKPVAVAGVMGGQESEIHPGTTRVLLESAFFEPRGIRRTSKRLGLSTEASFRFEREIDKEGTGRAADRAAMILQDLTGGRLLSGAIDLYPTPFQPLCIPLDVSRVNRLLGTSLEVNEVKGLLRAAEISVRCRGEELEAVPPSFRPDIRLPEDLAEEVARFVGYDAIPTALPRVPVSVVLPDPEKKAEKKVRDVLVGMGFHETIHYSFHGRDRLAALGIHPDSPLGNPVVLQNPLSETQSVLRTTLVGSLLDTVARNVRSNRRDLRLFELRRVFFPPVQGVLPVEKKMLAGVLTGHRYPRQWNQPPESVDFFDLKGVLDVLAFSFGIEPFTLCPSEETFCLHPGVSGDILIHTTKIGWSGKLHPRVQETFDIGEDVFLFEMEFSPFVKACQQETWYRPFVRNPSVQRDIALVLDQDVPHSRVKDRLFDLIDRRVTGMELFDVYQGPQLPAGKRSMAFRITYQDPERTLTDEEVNELQRKLLDELLLGLGANLR
jgi:phenylalanyl-tRNA synthetase beta chain